MVDKVVGMEARGFILAAPVALALGVGFVPVRKPGKLPWETRAVSYELEYGAETLEMHTDALAPGERVLLVDDVLATGGTARATGRAWSSRPGAVGARPRGADGAELPARPRRPSATSRSRCCTRSERRPGASYDWPGGARAA